MAQAEDTELRDLVIEALEKNGSLAKIRALLRANLFLAFEDECETMKQNVNLDNILKLPEGVFALTIVHEFLEFCNLKNTLFVYMSESRQGRDYAYEGRDMLAERLQFINGSTNMKEPVLLTLLKNILRPYQRKFYDQGDAAHIEKHSNTQNQKDDQNCTYIVHEDSSASTSISNSDNSSDEKNKLHLKLALDNSDTDTSSDSTREKSSEYIPNQHILSQATTNVELSLNQPAKQFATQNESNFTSQIHEVPTKIINSSDSTSYIDIKSYKAPDPQSVPSVKVDSNAENSPHQSADMGSYYQDPVLKADSVSSATLNSIASLSQRNEVTENVSKNLNMNPKTIDDKTKSDTEATEYSLDFTSSPASKNKNKQDGQFHAPERVQDNISLKENASPNVSPRQNSQSSQSSVSISDVADLIEYSDKNLYDISLSQENLSVNSPSRVSHKSKDKSSEQNKLPSDDSGDFSESPIPSLSNLSLDVHSD